MPKTKSDGVTQTAKKNGAVSHKSKTPSPCIGVCKFRRADHCIGCSMTKPQKKLFKSLKKDAHKRAFVELLLAQQEVLGKYSHWRKKYAKKLRKKNVTAFAGLKETGTRE